MTSLQQAAQALLIRHEKSCLPHPESYLALSKALDAELAQSVEPYAVFHGLVDSGEHGAFNLDLLKMIPRGAYLYLHPPQRTQPSVPVTANDDEVICPSCCHQFRAIPVGVQQLMLDAGFEPPFKHPPQQAVPKNFVKLRAQLEQEWVEVRAIRDAYKSVTQQAKPKTMGEVQEMCIAALQRDERAKVGDSRFEGWYSELNQAGKGSKQIAREAYEAGLNEADAQQAYDQQAMELCNVCGWKAIIPGEPCLVCNMNLDAQQAKPTGWDNGLSQDYCKEFGQWLASRPGARQQVKEMFEADAQQPKQDKARLDWLERNLFHREHLDIFGKVCRDYNMWVIFSPVGVQGSARTIIDAAMAKEVK